MAMVPWVFGINSIPHETVGDWSDVGLAAGLAALPGRQDGPNPAAIWCESSPLMLSTQMSPDTSNPLPCSFVMASWAPSGEKATEPKCPCDTRSGLDPS